MKQVLKIAVIVGSALLFTACGQANSSASSQMSTQDVEINLGAMPQEEDRQFVNLVSVKVKAELLNEFLSELIPYAELSRGEDGILRYDIHQSPHDPKVIELYEVYENREARIFHNNTDHRNKFFAKVGERGYFAEAPTAKVVYLIDPR